ncbi:hypothetical protein RchiOBHm_Chr4g0411581 [Rosa chinensis]|uniref:Uncharacterized protein n=1 Tax=Rosa chinensis TaxID=74649 RepID=A0A2P6QVM5_ROSCH|nr:hypothetical protein RchiOBHm_Chr4g0411581 [Rosa chinensis]
MLPSSRNKLAMLLLLPPSCLTSLIPKIPNGCLQPSCRDDCTNGGEQQLLSG